MKKQVLKISRIIATFLLSVISLFCGQASLFAFPVFADSANVQEAFENINVLDDLKETTIDGKKFDLTDYNFDETKELQIFSFVEFCYSFRRDNTDNYGLYVYIYNPQGLKIENDSSLHSITIRHGDDNSQNFVKYPLLLLNQSAGNYYGLFYKFKVSLSDKQKTEILQGDYKVNSTLRRYEVGEIELKTPSEIKSCPVGIVYKFSGYAKGYGADESAESTLSVKYSKLDTIKLSLNHTYWRSNTSSLGKNHQNQVDTVYFAVPNRYFEQYGKLQRIKAEWYEYKTKDLIVTSNSDFYNTATQYIGQNIEYDKSIGYGLAENPYDNNHFVYADWAWNVACGITDEKSAAHTLYYLFKTDDITSYDPYKAVTSTGGIEGSDLYSRMLEVSEKLGGETIEAKDGKLISALFEDDIDESRKRNDELGTIKKGYSCYDFDAELSIDKWLSWNDTQPSFWDNTKNYGFWNAVFKDIPHEEGKEVQPIVDLKDADFSGTIADISQNLMVNQNDVSTLQKFYEENKADNHIIAFRFAVTDYYSAPVDVVELGGGLLGADKYISGQAYRAKQSVFFDFNVIQLTFNDNGEYTVIPVVSNPIDVINDITSPTDSDKDFDWKKLLKIVLGGLLLIVLLVILMPLFPSLISLIIKIAILPFRLIAAIFKAIFHKRE